MAEIAASNANVAQQAKLLDEAGSAWNAVKLGDLEVESHPLSDLFMHTSARFLDAEWGWARAM